MRTAARIVPLLLTFALPAQDGRSSGEPVGAELESLEALYRHFHRNPELSYREVETSARLAEELQQAGYTVTRGVGGHGVVAVLENGKSGPTLLLRADMDALPVGEQTGLEYASRLRSEAADGRVAGVMHACGHDLHMTVLVGAARMLARQTDRWSGTLVLIGQPAEERVGGARAMLEDGLFERFPRPDAALALHVSADMEVGTVGYRSGYVMANVDSVDIHVKGRGGHGAAPHTTIDPIVQAAQLVLELQTIVSRELPPTEAGVVTVGAFHAGSKHNIISDRAHLQLTVRSYGETSRELIKSAIVRKAKAVALAAGAAEPEIEFSEGNPALYNDPELVQEIVPGLIDALGSEAVQRIEPAMVAEDFALFQTMGDVPVFMFRLGTIDRERMAQAAARDQPLPSLHSPFYYPAARQSIASGVKAMTAAALRYLTPD